MEEEHVHFDPVIALLVAASAWATQRRRLIAAAAAAIVADRKQYRLLDAHRPLVDVLRDNGLDDNIIGDVTRYVAGCVSPSDVQLASINGFGLVGALRFTSIQFAFILERIQSHLVVKGPGRPYSLTPTLQLVIFLEHVTQALSYSYLSMIHHISKNVVGRIIRRVARAVLEVLTPEFVRWGTPDEVRARCAAHKLHYGIPGIAGFIDGTHIPIRVTNTVEAQCAVNRKSQHTVVLQAVCDANLVFLDVSAGSFGSDHDAFVFQHSRIRQKFVTEPETMLPDNACIVGDAAYPISAHCIQGFRTEPTTTVKRFNFALSSQRQAVEGAFGRLKALFALLTSQRSHGAAMTGALAMVCCTLANIHALVDPIDASRSPTVEDFVTLEMASQGMNGADGAASAPASAFVFDDMDADRAQGRIRRWERLQAYALANNLPTPPPAPVYS